MMGRKPYKRLINQRIKLPGDRIAASKNLPLILYPRCLLYLRCLGSRLSRFIKKAGPLLPMWQSLYKAGK
jgi:hypothetical protein